MLSGDDPFDESTMLDEDDWEPGNEVDLRKEPAPVGAGATHSS